MSSLLLLWACGGDNNTPEDQIPTGFDFNLVTIENVSEPTEEGPRTIVLNFKDKEGNLFAVDLKSSYRKDETHINVMTLGAFTGYFRKRQSKKNITHPYDEYKAHIVLGVIYDTVPDIDERKTYTLDQLSEIVSVIKNFQFFVQEKWQIAIDRPGSGNTKNIGSVSKIEDLVNGNGTFAKLGEDIFNDYWMYYLTADMAKKAELPKPYYSNLAEYKQFKHMD